MNPADTVSVCSNVIQREVSGETVLLHLDSGTYFGLNEVGAFIWLVLCEGPQTLTTLSDKVVENFDVEPDRALKDLLSLAGQLRDNDLLSLEP